MPHKKKELTEMTDREVMSKLFSKKVVRELDKAIADEKPAIPKKPKHK